LLFFIVASVVANAYYYQAWPFVFDRLMPWFATLALPLALALFAEEFGAEMKLDDRARKRAEKVTQETEADATPVQGAEATTKAWQAMTKMERVRTLHDEMPHWSRATLAQEVGCSASTVTRALMIHAEPHPPTVFARTKGE